MDPARSFVDDNAGMKWCPAADCGRAVKARPGTKGVECLCGERFCFQCGNDDHSPCSCEDLKRWLVKCKDDSETFNWLLANTKPCPKCGTSIEKNGGCNHSELLPTWRSWGMAWPSRPVKGMLWSHARHALARRPQEMIYAHPPCAFPPLPSVTRGGVGLGVASLASLQQGPHRKLIFFIYGPPQ